MTIEDLAKAHLATVDGRIRELHQQMVELDKEIKRLTGVLEEGTKLLGLTPQPSEESNV
jgi:hypothetical protein